MTITFERSIYGTLSVYTSMQESFSKCMFVQPSRRRLWMQRTIYLNMYNLWITYDKISLLASLYIFVKRQFDCYLMWITTDESKRWYLIICDFASNNLQRFVQRLMACVRFWQGWCRRWFWQSANMTRRFTKLKWEFQVQNNVVPAWRRFQYFSSGFGH